MKTLTLSLLLLATPVWADTTIAIIADAFSHQVAPALTHVRAINPAEVWSIGDFPHDNPGANCTTVPMCQAKMETMYRKLYAGETVLGRDFKREILDPGFTYRRLNDDHDNVRDNVNRQFRYWPAALNAYLAYHTPAPDHGFDDGYMYQSFMVNGDTLVIFLDVRSHRDGHWPLHRTMLGLEQRDWLQDRLLQPPIGTRRVLLVSPVPVNPGQQKKDSWSGYIEEREWLHRIIAHSQRPTIILSADCHWGSMALGTPQPELNVPLLNQGFANTCNNNANQGWTYNSVTPTPGFGVVHLRANETELVIHNVDGTLRFQVTIPLP